MYEKYGLEVVAVDEHIREFFSQASDKAPQGNFHSVIALHDDPEITWKSLEKRLPNLCKGWFELSRLPSKDRIDFTRDYWLTTLPYKPKNHEALIVFFGQLDDIGIFIVQKKFDDPYECRFVYSLQNGKGFYHGGIGLKEREIESLQKIFPDVLIPEDFRLFLQIHNGFSKSTDTGVLRVEEFEECYRRFQQLLEAGDPVLLEDGSSVDPKSLIPFYESFGMPVFQCFWKDWYPEQEMGNVYYSNFTRSISDGRTGKIGAEKLAFPTFLDWLCFYLEGIE